MAGETPRQTIRVLVCGGRDYQDRDAVWRALGALMGPPTDADPLGPNDLVVIHGACPTGADLWADEFAIPRETRLLEFPADWRAHGRAAGPIRNARMLAEGKPDLVLAFPGGRGTADMVSKARAAGVLVRLCPDTPSLPTGGGDDRGVISTHGRKGVGP